MFSCVVHLSSCIFYVFALVASLLFSVIFSLDSKFKTKVHKVKCSISTSQLCPHGNFKFQLTAKLVFAKWNKLSDRPVKGVLWRLQIPNNIFWPHQAFMESISFTSLYICVCEPSNIMLHIFL